MPVSASTLMAPIMARQFCKLQGPPFHLTPSTGVPQCLASRPVATPLRPEAWRQALAKHPNPAWVAALVQGIQQGFRIGLQEHPQCRPRLTNTPSARDHSEVVDQFVQAQVSQGYMAGPFPAQDCANIITSGIAVIPKKTPGKWRVIVDMSSPQNASVNDYLRRELTHVAYASIEDAAHLMHHLGHNCQLAKLDIKEAYRIIPVHPEDRVFQGIRWKDAVYVDCQLPFGLASAPAIFSAVSQALEWILRQRGVRAVIHYMDDFLLLGAPGTPECSQALEITTTTCKELGIPLAEEKTEGPTTALAFLGIQLNAAVMSASLPADRLIKLQAMVKDLAGARVVRDRHKLESLVGHLVHASTVFPIGKAFLNALFALKSILPPGQARRLNLEARGELAWWDLLLENWPGISVHQFLLLRQPDHHLYTDAAGSWGCGAWAQPHWFQVPWSNQTPLTTIATKELLPIVLAVAVWGRLWRGHLVLCHCDNTAVVSQVNRLHARDPQASHMLRCLAFLQALHDCRIRAVHLAGAANTDADHLSRNRRDHFIQGRSQASAIPTQVPPELVAFISQQAPDWTSSHWRETFSAFWQREWRNLP